MLMGPVRLFEYAGSNDVNHAFLILRLYLGIRQWRASRSPFNRLPSFRFFGKSAPVIIRNPANLFPWLHYELAQDAMRWPRMPPDSQSMQISHFPGGACPKTPLHLP